VTVLDALQETLADEHATLYTYGVLGARTSASAAPLLHAALTTAFDRHRARRDRLRTMVEDAGGEPVAAAAAYELSGALRTVDEIESAALRLEERSTEVLAALVARSSGGVRGWALDETVWSATWQLELGGVATTWPGAPELD
jgi:DNA-directed RNA polymerase specialized sigma24 family protein